MAVLELKLFGGLSIALDGRSILEVKSHKGQALFSYLAVTHKRHARSALAGLFWTDMTEAGALMNLRKVVSRLKPLAPYLTVTREALAFNENTRYWIDIDEFTSAASQTADLELLRYAVSLYQGDFLDGFSSDGAGLFAEWVAQERARLRETALACLQKAAGILAARQNFIAAISNQRRLLEMDPWNEEAHRDLMRYLAMSGQRSAAITQYQTFVRAFAAELGLEPDPDTVQLHHQIQAGKIVRAPVLEGTPADAHRAGVAHDGSRRWLRVPPRRVTRKLRGNGI